MLVELATRAECSFNGIASVEPYARTMISKGTTRERTVCKGFRTRRRAVRAEERGPWGSGGEH